MKMSLRSHVHSADNIQLNLDSIGDASKQIYLANTLVQHLQNDFNAARAAWMDRLRRVEMEGEELKNATEAELERALSQCRTVMQLKEDTEVYNRELKKINESLHNQMNDVATKAVDEKTRLESKIIDLCNQYDLLNQKYYQKSKLVKTLQAELDQLKVQSCETADKLLKETESKVSALEGQLSKYRDDNNQLQKSLALHNEQEKMLASSLASQQNQYSHDINVIKDRYEETERAMAAKKADYEMTVVNLKKDNTRQINLLQLKCVELEKKLTQSIEMERTLRSTNISMDEQVKLLQDRNNEFEKQSSTLEKSYHELSSYMLVKQQQERLESNDPNISKYQADLLASPIRSPLRSPNNRSSISNNSFINESSSRLVDFQAIMTENSRIEKDAYKDTFNKLNDEIQQCKDINRKNDNIIDELNAQCNTFQLDIVKHIDTQQSLRNDIAGLKLKLKLKEDEYTEQYELMQGLLSMQVDQDAVNRTNADQSLTKYRDEVKDMRMKQKDLYTNMAELEEKVAVRDKLLVSKDKEISSLSAKVSSMQLQNEMLMDKNAIAMADAEKSSHLCEHVLKKQLQEKSDECNSLQLQLDKQKAHEALICRTQDEQRYHTDAQVKELKATCQALQLQILKIQENEATSKSLMNAQGKSNSDSDATANTTALTKTISRQYSNLQERHEALQSLLSTALTDHEKVLQDTAEKRSQHLIALKKVVSKAESTKLLLNQQIFHLQQENESLRHYNSKYNSSFSPASTSSLSTGAGASTNNRIEYDEVPNLRVQLQQLKQQNKELQEENALIKGEPQDFLY